MEGQFSCFCLNPVSFPSGSEDKELPDSLSWSPATCLDFADLLNTSVKPENNQICPVETLKELICGSVSTDHGSLLQSKGGKDQDQGQGASGTTLTIVLKVLLKTNKCE